MGVDVPLGLPILNFELGAPWIDVDVIGFDSSTILNLRVEIPRPMGNFPLSGLGGTVEAWATDPMTGGPV